MQVKTWCSTLFSNTLYKCKLKLVGVLEFCRVKRHNNIGGAQTIQFTIRRWTWCSRRWWRRAKGLGGGFFSRISNFWSRFLFWLFTIFWPKYLSVLVWRIVPIALYYLQTYRHEVLLAEKSDKVVGQLKDFDPNKETERSLKEVLEKVEPRLNSRQDLFQVKNYFRAKKQNWARLNFDQSLKAWIAPSCSASRFA